MVTMVTTTNNSHSGITGYFGKLHLYRDQYHPENTLPKAITTPAVDDLMWNTKSRKGFKKCVKLD